jgi:hypothetical protein
MLNPVLLPSRARKLIDELGDPRTELQKTWLADIRLGPSSFDDREQAATERDEAIAGLPPPVRRPGSIRRGSPWRRRASAPDRHS